MLPEYYAALDDPSGPITQIVPGQHQTPVSARIGDDRTGKLIATVRPPDGQTFVGLTAAADDRTFVVAAERFPGAAVLPVSERGGLVPGPPESRQRSPGRADPAADPG
jgi:hypothetical protein